MDVMSRSSISNALRDLALRRRLGDKVISLSEIARRSGLSRETLHVAARGEKVSETTQIRLSRVLRAIAAEPATQSRIMHINIPPGGGIPNLRFGIGPVRGGRG